MTGVAHQDYTALAPGFADPVHDAQACFRAVLEATAHPGRIVTVAGGVSDGGTLGPAARALALALCDIDTPVWLDAASAAEAAYLAFHCGAPVAPSLAEARFAFVADPGVLPPLADFALGTDEYPERSATLVVEVPDLAEAAGAMLRGPGILGERHLRVTGLPARFWAERAALAELFPRGLDVLFTSGRCLAALPRSTQASV